MPDLGSDIPQIVDADIADDVRIPLRKAAVAGWLYSTTSQLAMYVSKKLFGAMAGQAGKAVIVNEDEDGFTYGTAGGGGGAGVPPGGSTGQVLGKLSDADGDADWIDQTGGSGGGSGGSGFYSMKPLSDFTIDLGLGGSRFVTEVEDVGIVVGDTNTSGGVKLHGIYTDAPNAPYRVVIGLQAQGPTLNYLLPQVGWRDATTGKFINIAPLMNLGGFEINFWNDISNRGSPTSMAAKYAGDARSFAYGVFYIGLRDDGTNIYFEYSVTGHKDTFVTIASGAKSGQPISFDQIFLGMYQEASSGGSNNADFRILYREYDEDGLNRTKTIGSGSGGGGGGSAFTPPKAADFPLTVDPSGFAGALLDTDSAMTFAAPATGSGVHIFNRLHAVPDADWSVVARMEALMMAGDPHGGGLQVYNSVNGCGTSVQHMRNVFEVDQWNSPVAFGGNLRQLTRLNDNPFFKIARSGTDLVFSIGLDGENFVEVARKAYAAYLGTPTHAGLMIHNETSIPVQLRCDHYEFTH